MTNTNSEYDHKSCITAAELRDMGAVIPERIPDCAWVPRSSVMPVSFSFDKSNSTKGIIAGKGTLSISQPFQWIELTVQIPKNMPL